jgi:hypothetical protein
LQPEHPPTDQSLGVPWVLIFILAMSLGMRICVELASAPAGVSLGKRLGSTVGGIPRGGLVDRKQRSHIRGAVATSLAGEARLEVG